MDKKWEYSEEAMKEARERGKRITELIINGLKKAKELGIEDMTRSEAEAYLKKKEEQEKKEQKK